MPKWYKIYKSANRLYSQSSSFTNYAFAEHTFLGSRGVEINNKKMPELFWAFTNPIWIE